MKLFSLCLSYSAIWFNVFVFLKIYGIISSKRVKISVMRLFVLSFSSFFIFLSNYYSSDSFVRFIISVVSVMVVLVINFRESFRITLFKMFIIYLLLTLCDALLSIIYLLVSIDQSVILENINYIRALNTFLVSLCLLLLFLSKYFVKNINKLLSYVNRKFSYVFLFITFFAFLVFVVITHFNAFVLNIEIFVVSMLVMSFFLILCFIMIFQYFKNKHNEEEQQSLLDLMSEYETILDNDRINRHEMLNNLIVLKSIKDKSSKEFEETLNDIIDDYQDKKSELYSKLYKLPSGIKGIIYYKMAHIKNLNINLELVISPLIKDNFEKLDSKLYFKVCKILGIVLDNAIEASSLTENKILLIDIYLEDDDLVVYVENSFANNIDLNLIHRKGFSTKGSNRGYGLYVVKKMLEDTELLNFNQSIENNRFVTVFKIKNPSN